MSKKKEEYGKYLIQFNIKGTVEIANAFYVAYAIGYANSSEDSYSASESEQRLTVYRDAYLKMRGAVDFYSLESNFIDSGDWCKGKVFAEAVVNLNIGAGQRARQAIKEADELLRGKG